MGCNTSKNSGSLTEEDQNKMKKSEQDADDVLKEL